MNSFSILSLLGGNHFQGESQIRPHDYPCIITPPKILNILICTVSSYLASLLFQMLCCGCLSACVLKRLYLTELASRPVGFSFLVWTGQILFKKKHELEKNGKNENHKDLFLSFAVIDVNSCKVSSFLCSLLSTNVRRLPNSLSERNRTIHIIQEKDRSIFAAKQAGGTP